MSPQPLRGIGMQALAPRPSSGPAQFKPAGRVEVPVKEASDVVGLPDGSMLVVGDRSDKLAIVRRDGTSVKVKLEGVKDGKSGLEAVAYDPRKRHLFVVSEESSELLKFDFNPAKGKAELAERIKLPFKDGNKGVEGLTFLPGESSPTGKPQLVVAKEGQPRALYLLDADGTGKPKQLELDPALKDACKDFAALAVDPLTGHLFVASEESALAAEVKLARKGDKIAATLVKATPLRDEAGKALERVEGLAFDPQGNLHALLEDEKVLCRFQRR